MSRFITNPSALDMYVGLLRFCSNYNGQRKRILIYADEIGMELAYAAFRDLHPFGSFDHHPAFAEYDGGRSIGCFDVSIASDIFDARRSRRVFHHIWAYRTMPTDSRVVKESITNDSMPTYFPKRDARPLESLNAADGALLALCDAMLQEYSALGERPLARASRFRFSAAPLENLMIAVAQLGRIRRRGLVVAAGEPLSASSPLVTGEVALLLRFLDLDLCPWGPKLYHSGEQAFRWYEYQRRWGATGELGKLAHTLFKAAEQQHER